MKRLYIGIAVMVLLSPLGLLASGTAWGEWSSAELKQMVGYSPAGLKKLESLWSAPLADYAPHGWNTGAQAVAGYLLSATVGVVLILAVSALLGRYLLKSDDR